MSTDEPENGYLDDIAETRETPAMTRSSDEWTTPSGYSSTSTPSDPSADPGTIPSARAGSKEKKPKKQKNIKAQRSSGAVNGDGDDGYGGGGSGSVWRDRSMTTLRFLRTMIVTALVLSGLAAVANIAIHHLPRTTHSTYTYPNVQRILVAIDGDGSVDVHGTAGTDDVTIAATDKATLLQPVQRQIISSGGLLIVSVHCPSSECSSKYDITVPKTTEVTVTLDHSADQAQITAADLDSPVDLYTGHGNVTMTNLTANVHVVANGDVAGSRLAGQTIDVFAPIAKSVSLAVTGSPQLVRLTTGQPGQVSLVLPAGGYDITCEPKERCPLPGGTTGTGPITLDPNSPKQVQITVNPATTANITAGS